MTVSRMLARPLLATMFVTGGVNALKHSDKMAGAARPIAEKVVPKVQKMAPQAHLPSDPQTLVRINGATQVAAGLALATGRFPRTSALVLAGTLVPTTFAAHRFWEEQDPEQRSSQQVHFLKNVSMFGGLLLAGVDTDGRPGLAWRAKHAATDVRREARHLRREARREAKRARKSL